MKHKSRGQRLLIFLGIAILIMLLIDRLYPGWFPSPPVSNNSTSQISNEAKKTGYFHPVSQAQAAETTEVIHVAKMASLKPMNIEPGFNLIFHPELPEEKFMPFQKWILEQGAEFKEDLLETARHIEENYSKSKEASKPNSEHLNLDYALNKTKAVMQSATFSMPQSPPWIKYAANAGKVSDKPKIVIIIDDLGIRQKLTQEFIDLDGPVTLAFLPYAPSLQSLIDKARKNNHEAMIHMPMEPIKASIDPGPDAIMKDMSREELLETLNYNLNKATGYVGINNHMGSKVTQDANAMNEVMGVLRNRGLLFVDSRTINSSVALDYARKNSVPSQTRDVFIDHFPTEEFIKKSLKLVEDKALKKGYAIAIGHPYPQTIKSLKTWMSGLEDRGFELAPVTSVIDIPEMQTADYYNGARLIQASVSPP